MSMEEAATLSCGSFAAFVSLFHESGANMPFTFAFSSSPTLTQQALIQENLAIIKEEYGPSIFVLGGSSSVGQYTIQFARLAGFSTIITTASSTHNDHLMSLGASHVLSRDTPPDDIAALALGSMGNGVLWVPSSKATPLVVDCIATKVTQNYGVAVLNAWSPSFGGTLISMSTARPDNVPDVVDVRGIFALTFALKDISLHFFRLMSRFLDTQEVVPNRCEIVGGLEAAEAAMNRLEGQTVSGVKLVLKVSPN